MNPSVPVQLFRFPLPDVILGNLPSGVMTLDEQLRICSANPAAEQLFSTSWNSLRGRTLASLVAPHAPLVDLARQVQVGGSSISDYGVELNLARGEVMQVDCHVSPVVEMPGFVLTVLHPCSVARRLDRNMSQRGSSRSVAALARTLAHEVKNPLSGIRGAAQLLEPYVDNDDKTLIGLICDETDRICKLVERMEAFADVGLQERKLVNIHQVLEHVRRVAAHGFARHVRFVEHYDPSLPEVEADRDMLIQGFLNLVKNAAEAVQSADATITLATTYQHGLRMGVANSPSRLELPITVEFRDNGPGLQPDIVDHIFEPFVTTKPRGGGLGLSLVAKIISDHGGIIEHERGDPGCTFRVRLPVAPRGAQASGTPLG